MVRLGERPSLWPLIWVFPATRFTTCWASLLWLHRVLYALLSSCWLGLVQSFLALAICVRRTGRLKIALPPSLIRGCGGVPGFKRTARRLWKEMPRRSGSPVFSKPKTFRKSRDRLQPRGSFAFLHVPLAYKWRSEMEPCTQLLQFMAFLALVLWPKSFCALWHIKGLRHVTRWKHAAV